MALADFLGDLGSVFGAQPNMQPGMGGMTGGNPMGDTLDTPFAMSSMEQQATQKPPGGGLLGFFGKSSTRDAMGQIGDYLLQANEMAPIYGPRKAERDQKMMGEKLAQYMGTGDAALMDIIRTDPKTGMAILKMKQEQQRKAQDPTALQQNVEYLRRLNPNLTDAQLAEVAQYAIAAPRMYGSPESGFTPDPNYPFVRGQQAPQQDAGGVSEGQTATNPQTGEKIVFRNGAWMPAGGVSGNAGGGFP